MSPERSFELKDRLELARSYIADGSVARDYAASADKQPRIDVVCTAEPDAETRAVVDEFRRTLTDDEDDEIAVRIRKIARQSRANSSPTADSSRSRSAASL